jgi:hypothetical protein
MGQLAAQRDFTTLAIGAVLIVAAGLASARLSTVLALGPLVAILFFATVMAAYLFVPHVAIALTIPLFAFIPAMKVLLTPWVGPVKDIVALAAATAALLLLMVRRGRGVWIDRPLVLAVSLFLLLYVADIGGFFATGHGVAWAQGVRLVTEPYMLLMVGIILGGSRKTLNLAAASLVATGCAVALYGLYQQRVGGPGLIGLGYSYNSQVRTIAGHLRSFGTLDDPFAYAVFLLLALAAVMFWMRRRGLAAATGALIVLGLGFSFVRSALVISIALIAIWLVRAGRTALGVVLLLASAAAALTLLFAVAGASETRSVRAGPQTYITLNGRTKVWGTIFSNPAKLPFGLGVGEVGTAAQRAQLSIIGTASPSGTHKSTVVVDSGYFATVADVGLVGLAVLLTVLARLVALAWVATRTRHAPGWVALAFLVVLLIDAVTRASFTGFPTAFLGLLMVGVAVAAGHEERLGRPAPCR